jgi:type IV pilus assembly protein PilA
MLNRLQKLRAQQSEKGFTIIEVMIVLAIAGLIIVIVLLAVPALQRNGRNTGIRSDANQTLGYIATFNTDNQGANPTAVAISAGNVNVTGVAGTNASTGHIQAGTSGSYIQAAVPTAAAVTPAAGSVTVVLGARCPDTYSGTAITPTNSIRSVAVIYAIETTSGLAAQCIGS